MEGVSASSTNGKRPRQPSVEEANDSAVGNNSAPTATEEPPKRPKKEPREEGEEQQHSQHSPDRHRLLLAASPAPRRKLVDLMYIEKHSNGSGLALHAYQEELCRLDSVQLAKFAQLFLKNLLVKERGRPGRRHSNYCIGVVHGSAAGMPDLLRHLCRRHPHMPVKSRPLDKKNEIDSLTAEEFLRRVQDTYSHGTFRAGPLESISLVGTKGEETGNFFGDLLDLIEANPFLRLVMPWGQLSKLAGTRPQDSNDGPILWTRPGEQAIESSGSRRGSVSQLYATGSRGQRQMVISDRTHAHADHADDGLDRHTTAAVGLLQCVHASAEHSGGGAQPSAGRVCKDAVLFDPRHYLQLIGRLQLDIMEPPVSQCSPQLWLDDAELNLLRREGFRYSRQALRDNDVYFIPRGVVHQFRTVSAVTSVAWHVRMSNYYAEEAAAAAAEAEATTTETTETTTTETSTK